MLAIQETFSKALSKNVSSKAIWKKLGTLYDLEALDEAEAEADANEAVVVDFSLPEEEFGALILDKISGRQIKIEKSDSVSDKDNDEPLETLMDFKTESDLLYDDNEIESETPKATLTGKEVTKKEAAKRGPKKKETALIQEGGLKKDILKDMPRKELVNKKEVVKDLKKVVSKDDDMKVVGRKIGLEPKKDQSKEEKKDLATNKTGKKELADKKVAEQTKKETEVKRTDLKKTPDIPKNQRPEVGKPRAETPKQLRTEAKKAETKTLRSETPKPQSPLKPQRVEALKKEISSDKKKEVVDKKAERKSPEKTPESRGAKLRVRERKDTEPEKSDITTATKRERSRDSISKGSETLSEEPPVKKVKTPVPKGRPTRNSVDPQQKPTSPAVSSTSPTKRRSRLL